MAMLNDPNSALRLMEAPTGARNAGVPPATGVPDSGVPAAVRGRGIKCLFANCASLLEELLAAWEIELAAAQRVYGRYGDATSADYRAYDAAKTRRKALEKRTEECCL